MVVVLFFLLLNNPPPVSVLATDGHFRSLKKNWNLSHFNTESVLSTFKWITTTASRSPQYFHICLMYRPCQDCILMFPSLNYMSESVICHIMHLSNFTLNHKLLTRSFMTNIQMKPILLLIKC